MWHAFKSDTKKDDVLIIVFSYVMGWVTSSTIIFRSYGAGMYVKIY